MSSMKRLLASFLAVMILSGMMPDAARAATTVSTVNLYLNIASIGLTKDNTEKDAADAIMDNAIVNTEGLEVNQVGSGLRFWNEMYDMLYGIGEGSSQVDPYRRYYAFILVMLKDGYDWPDGIKSLPHLKDVPITSVPGIRVIFNGEVRNDAYLKYYQSSSGDLAIMVPIVNEAVTIGKKPSIRKPAAAKGKITVKWSHFRHTTRKTKAVWKKIKKVQIQCALDKDFTNIVRVAYAKKTKTQAVIKGLSKKTVYYVRVRYYGASGYSKWSKTKKIRTK